MGEQRFIGSSTYVYLFIKRLVLSTLNEALAEDPDRKCFRLVGGVLVERTVKDVVPALQTNRDGVRLFFKSDCNVPDSRISRYAK
jgi:hypothetical protein